MERPPHDSHFLRHVADLARRRDVITQAPIVSLGGTRLAESGQRFDPLLYDELVKHRLMGSIAESLSIADAVTPAALAQAVAELLADAPAFAELIRDEAVRQHVVHMFSTLPLSPPLAFKLTVAREERPELFSHSIKVGYCAAAIAKQSHLPPHEVLNAAAAGIFHDLGLLHVDPEMLRSRRPLLEEERRCLYTHPLTSFLILQRDPIWHPVVSTAVLEHHERIDGSGYPKGLTGNRLGHLGQLLAVAELAATLLAYAGSQASRHRLGVVLRLNEGKLSHEYSQHLQEMFAGASFADARQHTAGEALELLVGLSINFLRWQAVERQLPTSPMAIFISHRMSRLERSLAAAGIDLEYWYTFNADTDMDAKSLGELAVAAREGIWQMHAIGHEIRRRWDRLLGGSEPIAAAVSEWLDGIDNAWAA